MIAGTPRFTTRAQHGGVRVQVGRLTYEYAIPFLYNHAELVVSQKPQRPTLNIVEYRMGFFRVLGVLRFPVLVSMLWRGLSDKWRKCGGSRTTFATDSAPHIAGTLTRNPKTPNNKP